MVDDDRQRILARRARFVAAALASAGLASGCAENRSGPPPQACLSAEVAEDGGPPPEPCLSQVPDPPPQACLGPPPEVCLSVRPQPEPPEPPGKFAEPPPGSS